MSDLISNKALLKAMEKKYDIANETGMYPTGLSEAFIITEKIIQEQPITYDVDKVVEQIGSKIEPNEDSETGEPCYNWVVDMQNDIYKDVIKIVEGGLEE